MLALWTSLAVSVAATLLAGPPVTIEGEATCPRPSEVAAHLFVLLPGAVLPAPSSTSDGVDVARVNARDDAVEIVLRRPDGTVVGRRYLPALGSCDQRARATAIVLATWESDVHPAFGQPATPPLPPPPIAAVQPPPIAGTPPSSNGAGVASVVGLMTAVRPRATWDVGVGVSDSFAGGAFATGGQIVATLFGARGLGAQLSGCGEGDRSTAAGPGQAIWSRFTARIGPSLRQRFGDWTGDANISFVAGMFRARGQNYPVTYGGSGFDGGASTGLRMVVPGATWRPWLMLDATRWLNRRTVREAVLGQVREIPAWSVSASVGFSFFAR